MSQNLNAFLNKQAADRWEYDEAARRFTTDCAVARNPGEAKGHLPALWALVEDVARKYPEHHKKLVGLLDSIHRLPDLVIRDETAVKWSELPFLVEGWDQIYNRPKDQYSEEIVSVIAFIARLFSAQLLPHDEFLRWVDRDMHTALERGPEDPSSLKRDDLVLLDVNVPIAAQWIQHAGLVIWNCEADLGLSKRPESLWQGNAGFSYPRWKFWKERAFWVTQSKLVSSRTRDVAKEMVEEMTRIEKQDGL
ncbi:hypothetical protein PG984_016166 [Apiospora sp. TS-2023a]